MNSKFIKQLLRRQILRRDSNAADHHIKINEFDEYYYSIRYPDYCLSNMTPEEHYESFGKRHFLAPNALAEIAPLFDAEYYTALYPDVATAPIAPINHFFFYGAREGRRPNPLFNPNWYSVKHPEVNHSGLNPLTHWARFGWRTGYKPSAWFDTEYYLENSPDVARARIDPLWHFLQCGCYENRPCHPDINPTFYIAAYPDTERFARGSTLHFLLHGAAEGRNPNPHFNADYYGLCMADKMGAGQTPQEHWVHWGIDGKQPYAPPRRAGNCLPVTKSRPASSPEVRVAVIVPVYRGLEETRRCIETALNNRCATPFELVVINDSSPEPQVVDYLNSLAGDNRLTILHNPQNLGFVGTVNRGMSMFPKHDVVLLNSDTEVPERWLDRLVAHAYGTPYVGSVTPLSNNATICSYPTFAGSRQMPEGETLERMDRACETANAGLNVPIPTGVGFCMYIRRQCLDEIGLFDEDAFGKGYGEENDFCLRSSARGWSHLLALDTYVFHNGEVSFGETSTPGKARAMEILLQRYPDYRLIVGRHIAEDPGWSRRIAITAERYRSGDVPVVLTITHGLGGGTEKHVAHLRDFLGNRVRMLELRPTTANSWSAMNDRRVHLVSGDPAANLDMKINATDEFDELVALLKSFGVQRCHIHHTLFLTLDVERLMRALDVPFDFTVHDYFSVCPQVHLLTDKGSYCGEPDNAGCNACIAERPAHGARDIASWRGQMGWLINHAQRVLCPSEDTAARIRRYHPSASQVQVISHSHLGEVPPARAWAPPLAKGEKLRVAVLGVMALHKGGGKLLDCARLAKEQKRPLAFTVIGYLEGGLEGQGTGLLEETGRYNDADLTDIIARTDPHVIWFPALWPETYSYTLSAALASGRPVISGDIGAIAERLAGREWCWQVPWDQTPTAMNMFFEDIAKQYFRPNAPPPVQGTVPAAATASFYTTEYLLPMAASSQASAPRYPLDLRRPSIVSVAGLFQSTPLHTPGTMGTNPDPCGYIRGLLPLQSMGDDVITHAVTPDNVVSVITDALFVQRTVIPTLQCADRIIAHCRRHGIRIAYDIDDNLFALPPSHRDYAAYQDKLHAAFAILKAAEVVTVSTEMLRQQLVDYNPRVQVIPNALSTTAWGLRAPLERPTKRGPVRLLYMGTATHQADFEMVRPALERLKAEFGNDLAIEVVGVTQDSYVDNLFRRIQVPSVVVESYPLFARWLRKHGPWDIGIAPLVDDFFNCNKSDIKVLDYTAVGAAVACSDLAPYNVSVVDGHNGMLVGYGDDEWHGKLRTLIVDPALRQQLWQASWKRMLAERTLDAQRPLRQKVLSQLRPLAAPVAAKVGIPA